MLKTRISDDVSDVLKVISTLTDHLGELPCGQRLAENLNRIVMDGSYRLLLADEEQGSPAFAAGILTFFKQPMAERHLLAVEALWFRDDHLAGQLDIWRLLIQFAQRLEFGGVCVTAMSTNAVNALREMTDSGSLCGYPVTVSRPPLQKEGNPSPVYSAFSDDRITDSAFISLPALVVHTMKVEVDVSGREFA